MPQTKKKLRATLGNSNHAQQPQGQRCTERAVGKRDSLLASYFCMLMVIMVMSQVLARSLNTGGCKPRSIITSAFQTHVRRCWQQPKDRAGCMPFGNFSSHDSLGLRWVSMLLSSFAKWTTASSEDDEEGNGVICVCKCLIVNEISSSTSVKKLPLGIAFAFLALPMDVCWLPT